MRAIDADRLLKMMSHWKPYMDMDKVRKAVQNMPTLTPPNEPLTLDELRELHGEPVWVNSIRLWGIVRVYSYGIRVLTKSGEFDITRMKIYRRPPEGEEDT